MQMHNGWLSCCSYHKDYCYSLAFGAESSQHAMLSDVLDAGPVQQIIAMACTPWCFPNSLKLLRLYCKLVLQS